MPRRRKATLKLKKKMKKENIVTAAIKMFAKKGYFKTKIADIAKEARVADGTIYLYFSNKEDLLIKSIESLFSQKLTVMQKSLKSEPDELKKIYKFIQYHIDIFTENPDAVKFIVLQLRQSPEFYKKYPNLKPLKKYLGLLKKLCTDAVKSGKIRKVNPSTLTRIIFGIIDFTLTEWALNDSKIDLNKFKNEVLEILQYGLKV